MPLRLEKVTPWLDQAQWPMTYDISIGVRRDQLELKDAVESILEKDAAKIATILKDYGVPSEPIE